MPQGGTLRIQTARHKGGLFINVTDNGIGIPKENLSLLFKPFFSTKKHGEGMGLGLSVSANIIESYGGSIEVDSEVGQGTVFRIFLPEYPLSVVGERFPGRGDFKAKEEQHV
jgi:signal transduction histidine kinase